MSSGARCLRGDQSIGARCPNCKGATYVHWVEVSSNPSLYIIDNHTMILDHTGFVWFTNQFIRNKI